MSDIATDELGDFFDYIWSDTEGYVYLPIPDLRTGNPTCSHGPGKEQKLFDMT